MRLIIKVLSLDISIIPYLPLSPTTQPYISNGGNAGNSPCSLIVFIITVKHHSNPLFFPTLFNYSIQIYRNLGVFEQKLIKIS